MKWLYINANGRDRSISAKTRSWMQAELTAETERGHHDPVQKKLREVEETEKLAAEKLADQKAQNITVSDALARWVAGLKGRKESTVEVHSVFRRKVEAWAQRIGVQYLNEITPDQLDA